MRRRALPALAWLAPLSELLGLRTWRDISSFFVSPSLADSEAYVPNSFSWISRTWATCGRLVGGCMCDAPKPRRDGLKSVRSCGEQHELDVRTMLWTRGKAFPILMLSSRMRCPKCGTREVVITVSLPGSVLAAAARAGSL